MSLTLTHKGLPEGFSRSDLLNLTCKRGTAAGHSGTDIRVLKHYVRKPGFWGPGSVQGLRVKGFAFMSGGFGHLQGNGPGRGIDLSAPVAFGITLPSRRGLVVTSL